MKKLFIAKYLDTDTNKQEVAVYVSEELEGFKKLEEMFNRFGINHDKLFVEKYTYISGYEIVPFELSFQRAVDSLKPARLRVLGKSREYVSGYRKALKDLVKLISK